MVNFLGRAIPASWAGIDRNFKFTFQGLKNAGKLLWLYKAIPEIHKPLKMVLCSSREIVS
jgi:hypothetical protein